MLLLGIVGIIHQGMKRRVRAVHTNKFKQQFLLQFATRAVASSVRRVQGIELLVEDQDKKTFEWIEDSQSDVF
jgi:hypothetical protein